MKTYANVNGQDVEVRVTSRGHAHYAPDDATFPAAAYRYKRMSGVAWHIMGHETEWTEDTEWDGIEVLTGRVIAVMVGDDSYQAFDPEDFVPLERSEYCGGCGQIGCGCNTEG